jgi:hypothetical protein
MGAGILDALAQRASQAVERHGLSGLYDMWLKRSSVAVEDNIPELGKALTGSLKYFKEKFGQEYGAYTSVEDKMIRQAEKYPEVRANYYDYFTGNAQHSDPIVRQLADFHKRANLEEYAKAGQVGVPLGPPNPDNFSRKWMRGKFSDEKQRAQMMDHLIKTGQAKSATEAKRILDIIGERSKGKKSYNLRIGRKVDLPGWRKDIYSQQDAMREKVYDRVYTEVFGEGGKTLNGLLDTIRKTNGHAAFQLANRYVDVVLRKRGEYYQPYTNAERTVNSILAARYLGAISIRHAGQSLNALVFGGRMRPMLDAIMTYATDPEQARYWGLRSGSLTTDAIGEMKKLIEEDVPGAHKLGSKIFEVTGFPKLMRMNRTITSLYGKYLAEDLVDEYTSSKSPYVARKLAQLGIDADKALENGLSLEDLYRASSRTTEVTMSPLEHENLPLAWRSNMYSRWMTQYKPFIYMQTQLLKNHMIKPAMEYFATGGKSGDIKPLIYYSLLFPTAGEIIGDAYNLATKGDLKSRPGFKYPVDRAVDNIAWLGGLGALNDLIFALTSPEGSNLLGPLEGEIADLKAIWSSKHKGKQIARQVPIVGRAISAQMKPKQTHKARGLEGWLQEGHLTKGLERLLGR